jgi:hypothetical protein
VKSDLETEFLFHVKALGISTPRREAKIIPGRKFRFDFVWDKERVAAEIQGGTWKSNTGHTSGSGIERDCEKHNLAVLAGWRTLLFTGSMVHSGVAAAMLEKALK